MITSGGEDLQQKTDDAGGKFETVCGYVSSAGKKECHELRKAIEYMNERHQVLMSMIERKQKLVSIGRQNLGGGIRFVGEEASDGGALDRKEEIPKRESGETMLWLGVGVAQKAAAGSRSSETEVISSCQRWEFIKKARRRVRNPLAKRSRRGKEEQ